MRKSSHYNSGKAAQFWSKRLTSTDPLSAVLTYSAPKAVNELYDEWERAALVTAVGKLRKGTTSLDIGCGVGRITLTLAALGAEVTGVDVSEAMLVHCAKEAKRRKLQSRVTLVQTSAESIPFSSGSFDLITCFGLLEHLPQKPRQRCVQEALRLLKRQGRLFMVVNNTENIFLKPRYHLKAQRPDGYFVDLVGLDWLMRECSKENAALTVVASNPFYGLLHYGLLSQCNVSDVQLRKLCRYSQKADREAAYPQPFSRSFASHFMVCIQKR